MEEKGRNYFFKIGIIFGIAIPLSFVTEILWLGSQAPFFALFIFLPLSVLNLGLGWVYEHHGKRGVVRAFVTLIIVIVVFWICGTLLIYVIGPEKFFREPACLRDGTCYRVPGP